MNIAFVTDDLRGNSNGIYASAMRYCKVLRDMGHTVKMIGYGAEGPDSYPVPMRQIPLITRIASSCGFTFGEPSPEIFEEALDDVDLVHLFLPFTLEAQALLWARKHQIPVSAAFHLQPQNMTYNAGFEEAPGLSDAIFSFFKHRLYSHVRHVQCPSEMIKKQLEEHGYETDLHVISNGVPVYFQPDENASFGDGKFHIVTVGRFAPEKNQKTIIAAVGASCHVSDIVLHVCGKGNLEEDLKRQAEEACVDARFDFLSEKELLGLEQKCDLYVHASVVDIEAMSVLEGFAAGAIPVIGKAPLSAPSAFALCEESLFDAEDSLQLRDRIDYWIEHPEARRHWKPFYQEEAKQHSVPACVAQFLKMEEEAIEEDREAYELNLLPVPKISLAPSLPSFTRRKA